MANDFEIGRVVAVDTAQVTIELNKDLRAFTRSTYEGVQEVGRINSYVIIPVGAHRLVAILTRVMIAEEAEIRADRTMVTLPSARRLMKATLIGTIDRQSFTQGIFLFPVLDNPVLLPAEQDLDVIFGQSEKILDPDNPGFCIEIGDSALFKGRRININPDALFGKHAAVLGSTGSGKSCTIAALLQSILARSDVHRTTFVILDTNGEYRSAFQRRRDDGGWEDIGERSHLYIPSDPRDKDNALVIPYWFLNADDFTRLFRAAPGVQRPVLLDALTLSRLEAQPREEWRRLRDDIVYEANSILAYARSRDARDARVVRQLCDQILMLLGSTESLGAVTEIQVRYGVGENEFKMAFQQVRDIVREGIQNEGQQFERYEPVGANKRRRIESILQPLLAQLTGQTTRAGLPVQAIITADTPVYFDKMSLRHRYLEEALARQEVVGGRARDNCATMLLRIYRLLEDKRFEFLFGTEDSQFPNAVHSLGTFLRDILGLPSAPGTQFSLDDNSTVPEGILPFYNRQRNGTTGHQVVIVDLSLLAAEVLENVTALIGRLILEFLQRLGEHGGEEARGSLPVVLVLEEAQNYIREQRYGEEESISREVFERIAREGRKFGLGLVVSSQRPSELSKTVLSQCSSFIVHRLQNPEDLRYFKDIVPSIYGNVLEQLPALAPQTALIVGECVRAPVLVRIREAKPSPRSRDPKFYKYWASRKPQDIPVEDICARWEGSGDGESGSNGEDAY
ncbi:MAG: ATP-binding protein [Bacillota bacterium]